MTSPLDEYRSRLRESLGVINELKGKISSIERTKSEPIAIVGMACRFPGGSVSPDAYWNALVHGVDGVVEIPPERWPVSDVGTIGSEARWAALIDGIDQFDAGFFGISPREAASLDPQHRLLLEIAQSAIDDAGILTSSLSESRTGVYVGMCTNDYWHRIIGGGVEAIDTYGATGNLFSTAAGRISYWLGAQGPCISIDTACSSSLVAIHFACQDLRNGDCNLAIVGGVNAIVSPFSMVMMSRLGALSPDGRCKTFDARANGYVRGEGCGVVIIKRLSDAQRDGDRIYGLILGSAINQDGRSTGLTTPNVLSQQALLRQALENSKISPADIGYVETHGTGTPLGDPIEFDALKAILGTPRENHLPCVLGAVKTNIGHLEGAAGVASLIKAILCLEHKVIPKNLHQRALNPRIDIEGTPFLIPRDLTPWPQLEKPRRAGVSSFGISGTNAHVILQEAPVATAKTPIPAASSYLLPLSAKSADALSAVANSYANWLSQPNDTPLHDIVYTASARRTHHDHRLAAVAQTREEYKELLQSFAQGDEPRGVVRGQAISGQRPRILFVFSGQGSQWPEMGKTLLVEEPIFRDTLQKIDSCVRRYASFSILDEIEKSGDASDLDDTSIVQPVLFALQVGLTELFKSWGIEPSAVIGHSVGEIAAAYVAGALSLDDAARLVVLRGNIMQKATGHGKMFWAGLPPEQAVQAIAEFKQEVSVAAINDPTSVVLSGKTSSLEAVLERLQSRGVETRPLRVNYAFHSPQMEPLARELVLALGRFEAKPNTIAHYSTVTGARIEGPSLDSSYWGRNVRATVNLAGALQRALDDDFQAIVEIGPHPVLVANIQQCATEKNAATRVIPTLRRQAPERRCMLEALGSLHTIGVDVDWVKMYPERGHVVSLPDYPWQWDRYWIDAPMQRARMTFGDDGHPLLGSGLVPAAQPQLHIWEQWLSIELIPYLADHRVQGEIVFPGAGYVEMALAAANSVYGQSAVYIENIAFHQLLSLTENENRRLQISVLEEHGGKAKVTISSKLQEAADWILHASGIVRVAATSNGSPPAVSREDIHKRCSKVMDNRKHYAEMDSRGLFYGPSFRGVTEVFVGNNEILARVHVPDEVQSDTAQYTLHPSILDACFQATLWALQSSSGQDPVVPVGVGGLRIYERIPTEFWVHGQIDTNAPSETPTINLCALGENGQLLFAVDALRLRALDSAKLKAKDPFANCIFGVAWRRMDLPEETGRETRISRPWLVLLDTTGFGSALAAHLRAQGDRVVEVVAREAYATHGNDAYRLNPTDLLHLDKLLTTAFGNAGCRGVINCMALDGAKFQDTSQATLAADTRGALFCTLRLIQAVLKQSWRDTPRLYVLTRGAQAVNDESTSLSLSQSMHWGLGRVIAMEQPDVGCIRMDLPPEPGPDDLTLILRELAGGSDEDQIAYRSGHRYVARIVRERWEQDERARERMEPAAGQSYQLSIREPGVLERLLLRPVARRKPGPGEIEIEVDAAGLNFLDVMKAMGIYPGMDPTSIQLGGECSGKVVDVGEGVTNVSLGQSVIVSATACFASHLTTRAVFAVAKPEHMTAEEAATIPAVFMTVYWALHHVGRLARGERILIHSATGGTGLAAIQYARAVGAEVFATAGSEEKRAFLRSMGISHVMDSRSLTFANEIMAKTGGRGVDVVLNSLTGEALFRSLDILAPYGRFLEIGKKDIYENSQLGMLPFRKAISYTSIDLASMADERPKQFGTLLQDVIAKFADGTFQPEPITTFSTNEVQSAFRLMAQAKHIGKIAVRMRDPDACIHVPAAVSAQIRGDATYLITGGLGGLGLSLAEWMVHQGAKHLVLVGRSIPTAAAESVIVRMRAANANVISKQANVVNYADIEAVIACIRRDMPPLRGVVHAAAVLADRTVTEMGEIDFFQAIEPKVFGAWNLHEATRMESLDFFVMYSSSAGLLGSPGQANYSAANAFLDALAHARIANGLPATSIQWGPFGDVGLAAASDLRGNRIASRGSASFNSAEGNELFGRVIAAPKPEIALLHFDVRQWLEFYPQMAGAPFVAELLDKAGETKPSEKANFRDELERMAPGTRLDRIQNHLREQLGKVLRIDPARIDTQTPFASLGMDSLMSLELRNRLEASLGIKLSAALLFTYATTGALATFIIDKLGFGIVPPDRTVPLQPADSPQESVEATAISEQDDDDLLAAFDASAARVRKENLS